MDGAADMAEQFEFRVVKNDESESSLIALANYQQLVQKALPSMDKGAIQKTIFDPAHTSFVMFKKIGDPIGETEEVVAGVSYRVWETRLFVEVVYFVVDVDQQRSGHGSNLMNHFKDEIKFSMGEKVMEIVAYADDTATWFFKRHAFTREITLEKRVWGGIIKDYNFSSLMQCTLLPRVRYVTVKAMLRQQIEALKAAIAEQKRREEQARPTETNAPNSNDVVHAPPAQWQHGDIAPINPMDIPAIRASSWTPYAGSRPYFSSLKQFLDHLKTGQHSKAYLKSFGKPVDGFAYPDYHDRIAKPMDFLTIDDKLYSGLYKTPKAFIDDVKLIISNCRLYNGNTTIYHKHARWLESRMTSFIRDMPEWSHPVDLVN